MRLVKILLVVTGVLCLITSFLLDDVHLSVIGYGNLILFLLTGIDERVNK